VLISHGAVRASVMEFEAKKATNDEINKMCEIVDNAMKQGALGMSLGLQ
jgi:N-acyl-D-amino-acid deacylase